MYRMSTLCIITGHSVGKYIFLSTLCCLHNPIYSCVTCSHLLFQLGWWQALNLSTVKNRFILHRRRKPFMAWPTPFFIRTSWQKNDAPWEYSSTIIIIINALSNSHPQHMTDSYWCLATASATMCKLLFDRHGSSSDGKFLCCIAVHLLK